MNDTSLLIQCDSGNYIDEAGSYNPVFDNTMPQSSRNSLNMRHSQENNVGGRHVTTFEKQAVQIAITTGDFFISREI
jgi:hypothetical protein